MPIRTLCPPLLVVEEKISCRDKPALKFSLLSESFLCWGLLPEVHCVYCVMRFEQVDTKAVGERFRMGASGSSRPRAHPRHLLQLVPSSC